MKEKLVIELNELVQNGTKKSQLEEEIGLPENSLSAVLLGKKEMPESWVEKIRDYFASKPAPGIMSIEVPKTKMVVEKDGLRVKPADGFMDCVRATNTKINKDFGEGTVMILGDRPNMKLDVISTGSLGLDLALGIGGLPRGRIVEIYGPESSGKTTIATHVIAEAQKLGLRCALIDAEQSFDPDYAANLGVNVNLLTINQPSYGDQGLEIADRYICTGDFGLIVIDSVAALTPKAELEGEMGDTKMGLHARLMSQACRKITSSLNKHNTLCVFINQLRMNIGGYGNPEVTTGGQALKFYASVRLDVRRMAQIKDGEEAVGNHVKAKVVKNKCAPPFKSAEFDIMFGEGISRIGEIIDKAVELDILQKSGSWFNYGEKKLGQGRESLKQLLKDHPEMTEEIEQKIKEKLQ